VGATTDRPALIINADDFGMSEGINTGIIEAFSAGALTSTTIMVGMPAFEDAARRARSIGEKLGVGLHLNLTAGRPLTRAVSLVDRRTEEFLRPGALVRRVLAGQVKAHDVEAECSAQIARARTAGLQLTHLDGHHHVHLLPGVWAAVRRVLEAEGIPALRRPVERLLGVPAWQRRLPDRLLVRAMARRIDGCRTTDAFIGLTLLGVTSFHSVLVKTLDYVRTLSGTTELMVHPGYVPGPLPGNDPYTTQRESELRALTSPDVLERLHDGRIRLTHFGRF
jgi:predicted glycoside hydrolase/deacetylase ChbG (UPF0249 family)